MTYREVLEIILFFVSSRRRHTRYWRDWSSDVCSSDLDERRRRLEPRRVRPLLAHGESPGHGRRRGRPIGRASCRERGEISVVDVSLKKNTLFSAYVEIELFNYYTCGVV